MHKDASVWTHKMVEAAGIGPIASDKFCVTHPLQSDLDLMIFCDDATVKSKLAVFSIGDFIHSSLKRDDKDSLCSSDAGNFIVTSPTSPTLLSASSIIQIANTSRTWFN